MHTGIVRCRPAGSIHSSSILGRITLLPPVYKQSDGILRLRSTSQFNRSSSRSRRSNPDRSVFRHHTLTNVNVVRVQIIRDITVLSSPRLEGLQLTLRLAHVTVEVVEVAQVKRFVARIRVCGIKPLVVFNKHEDTMLARLVDQGQMVRKELSGGLGDEDVDLALDGVQSDGEVSRVGGEDSDGRAGLESINGRFVGIWVLLVVGWE